MDPGTILAAATLIKTGADIFGARSEAKAAQARSAALYAQAQRRLAKGRQEAEAIKTQGELNKTSMASRLLSTGAMTRESLAQDMTLEEIANRAKIESDIAMEDAEYEALSLQQDAEQMYRASKNLRKASYIGALGSILDSTYKYNEYKSLKNKKGG